MCDTIPVLLYFFLFLFNQYQLHSQKLHGTHCNYYQCIGAHIENDHKYYSRSSLQLRYLAGQALH